MSIRTAGRSVETARGSVCPVCGHQVAVERASHWTHQTCLRCGYVNSHPERGHSLAQAILMFMARG